MNVMVTGGAGYIGSHATERLLRDGHRVVVVDNLLRGNQGAIHALKSLPNGKNLEFIPCDVADRGMVEAALRQNKVDAVMHFAALAAVGESVDQPLLYYRNNVWGMVSLLEAVVAAGVPKFVFSSSCATYGAPPPGTEAIREDCPKNPMSPYGWTKLHGEHILRDVAEACRRQGKPFSYAALRYFNVAGAYRGTPGLIGEDHDPESHIIPVVIQAAMGQRPHVGLFGTDYPTPDGTCVRDYVHVEDLVDAHVAVMGKLAPGDERHYNLGIGKGYSVREIIDAVRKVTGRDFKVVEQPRRAGDPPRLFADPAKIRSELGWNAKVTDLNEIIGSAWAWHQKRPRGYRS